MIFWLYTIDFLGKLCVLCSLGLFVCAFLAFFAVMGLVQEDHRLWNIIRGKVWVPLVLGLILILTPSQKSLYLMLSTKMMRDVVTEGKLSAIGEKSLKLLEQKLDALLQGDKT